MSSNVKRSDGRNRKEVKKDQQANKSRLIIRNLSFKTTETDLRTAFAPFGTITDVNMPKKEDGQFRGFAFIAFDNIGSSLRAIKQLNGKEICERKVAVDFSVNKTAYDKAMEEKKKNEPVKEDKKPVKKTPKAKKETDVNNNDKGEDKAETVAKKKPKKAKTAKKALKKDVKEEDKDQEVKVEAMDVDEVEGDVEMKEKSDDDDDDRNDEEMMDIDFEEKPKKTRSKPDPGLTEGRTLFIRNLDLDTTESSLAELCKQFGDIVYCKICMNPYTEKSKGTAFVLYKTKESADKCLAEASNYQSSAFYLDGQQLTVSLALERNRLYALEEEKRNRYKDKRNLYLAKEGLIYPKSPAAAGVSQPDLKKRVELEEKKRQQLQNLHYFISDKRLCVHNIPEGYSDKKLHDLFLAAADDKTAKITWAKVMKNRSKLEKSKSKQFGQSKGFGFVEFSEHWHALKSLRFLNNNPDVWTSDRRPIVEFSVENKIAVNIKKYREMAFEKKKNEAVAKKKEEVVKSEQKEEEAATEAKKTKNRGRRKSRNERIAGQKARKAAEEITGDKASGDKDSGDKDAEYSGVQSKPTTGKVIAPKMNRKIRAVKEDLLKNKQTLKNEKRKAENKKRHLVNLEKQKAKREVANEKASKRFREEEESAIDAHFHKRKRVFLDQV